MRVLVLSLTVLIASACSTSNVLRGSEDFYANHYANELRHSIDDAISREIAKEPPNGYLTHPYSRSVWNRYWNDRIYSLYELGNTQTPNAYQGPTGPEFIEYIFEARASAGLPPIEVEGRNVQHIPAT